MGYIPNATNRKKRLIARKLDLELNSLLTLHVNSIGRKSVCLGDTWNV